MEEKTILLGENMIANGFRPFDRRVPLTEALVRWSLPLPREIVTTDVSPCGNAGACVISGGWAGDEKTREVL